MTGRSSDHNKKEPIRSVLARVFGIVQGVGFRPTVSRHALACGVAGYVSNMGPYVEIAAKGSREEVEAFLYKVRHEPPKRSVILRMDVTDLEEDLAMDSFEIIESEKREGDIFVSPDIAVCDECVEEMYDPANRRYLHPFINCTCCGPRLTILDAMPYDRVRTSMGSFPMCKECSEEYTNPESRRYDAQPVCCNDCGPQVYLLDHEEDLRGAPAIRAVRQVIRDGGIAAIKGIGGFHLCCDATSGEAVEKLRTRKRRPMKPFAVMMKDIETVQRECIVPDAAVEILTGHQKPIILLPVSGKGKVCRQVAPDNPKLGVMLPYAPVQLLLFDSKDDIEMPDCLVMTSANSSGAPICRDDTDARAELSALCDVILSHDRLIRIRADDTVIDFYDDEPYMIRRSRGYAPLPVMTGEKRESGCQVVAVGGELKNSFCIAKDSLYYVSPYIGDMTDLRTVRALEESVRRMEDLLEAKPTIAACDLHPGYNSVAFAKTLGLPLYEVQHHYAHILSCMAENDCHEEVIGVAFDGTGYGTDHTVWGGEILISSRKDFRRFASVTPFSQTGGDLASKEGWRIAVSLLKEIYGPDRAGQIIEERGLCTLKEASTVWAMEKAGINTVLSTSAGRLFDAVSALLGYRTRSTFEGEASMALQFAAERYLDRQGKGVLSGGNVLADETVLSGGKAFSDKPVSSERCIPEEEADSAGEITFEKSMSGRDNMWKEAEVDGQRVLWMPTTAMFKELTEQALNGADPDRLAWIFHRELAAMMTEACIRARKLTGINITALSGGCYQNTLLLRLSEEFLSRQGFQVLRHHLVPPNDGGICLGQAYGAMYHIEE